MRLRLLSLVLLLTIEKCVKSQNITEFLNGISVYKKCFYEKHPGFCLRKKVIEALNETILDDRPITIGFLEIQKNPDYFVNQTELENIPEATERSGKLGDVLMEKINEFFKSRTVKLNLSNAFEARKGGGGGGGGGGKKGGGNMAMMAAVGMCAMMANMVMGKMALMSGSALMIAKVSLLLSMVMLLKKMQEKGGGGEEKHIVYADSGHSHGGGGGGYGGGGGWHRSLEDPHNIIYKGQWTAASDNGSANDGFFYFKKTTKTW